MLLLDLGATISFAGIVIPALTGVANEHNRNEKLHLTAAQSSWLGNGFCDDGKNHNTNYKPNLQIKSLDVIQQGDFLKSNFPIFRKILFEKFQNEKVDF